jgi:integrase/recombinase XerC
MTLTRRSQSLVERSRSLAELSPEERRRYAAEAARDRDVERLWHILEAYLSLHGASGARVSPNTLRSYRRGLEVLLEAWGGVNLLRPESDDGVLFVRALEAQQVDEGKGRDGYALATIRNRLAAARTFYKALRWMGATEASPFENVRVARDLTESWDKQAAYSEHEVNLMAAQAKDQEDIVLLYLGAHGGLRVSEMLALAWKDIRFDVGELLVRQGKGRKAAWVSLSPTLQLELRRLPRSRDKVLSLTSWYGVYYRVRQMALKAGVPFLGIHALRHTAGTKLYEQTESLGVVADHLRHANVETARRYAKARSKRVKKALESW